MCVRAPFLVMLLAAVCLSPACGGGEQEGAGSACVDADQDGYGAAGSSSCPFAAPDCDDLDARLNPGAAEAPPASQVCGDGLDNNCNGLTDLDDLGCVSGRRFTDNGDGTVSDSELGLLWQQQDDGVLRNWNAARTYCQTLVLDNRSDWRCPSRDELVSLVDLRYSPTIDPLFEDVMPTGYWTSGENSPCCAWSVHFGEGTASNGLFRSTPLGVRCVHAP